MKVNELRIGNIVYYNGNHKHIGYVSEIQSHIFPLNQNNIGLNERIDIYYSIEKLNPIKLTEEWLLKLGFEIVIEVETQKYFKKDKIKIVWDELDNAYCYKMDLLSFIDIKTVHQLQNLYFALTQTELTIS